VPRRAYATLRAEKVPELLPHVPEDWRGVFAAALYTGMRKGELFGLRKVDVDLPGRSILVGRSYDRDTTKGGHADALPIAAPLVPFLEAAMRSPGELVFPWPDGRMRTREADPGGGPAEGPAHRARAGRAGERVRAHLPSMPERAPRPTWSGTATRRRAGARSAAWPCGPARFPGRSGSKRAAGPEFCAIS
jgi:integrase